MRVEAIAIIYRPSLVGWGPLLVGWRPLLVGWGHRLAIAIWLEATTYKVEGHR